MPGVPTPRLSSDDWTAMMGRIIELAKIAEGDYGVKSSLHPHAGCYIECHDELDAAMNDLPEELVGLCIDTGHSAYAGFDPVAAIRHYAPRIRHMHLKNIDKAVHAACVAEGVGFFDAIARGIFCPLGRGVVDFTRVRDVLAEIGFAGMAVVEQDVDPTVDASPRDNAIECRDYLASIGMAPTEALA